MPKVADGGTKSGDRGTKLGDGGPFFRPIGDA